MRGFKGGKKTTWETYEINNNYNPNYKVRLVSILSNVFRNIEVLLRETNKGC
jgi:hypothetical protein